jgi:hypothetical protein
LALGEIGVAKRGSAGAEDGARALQLVGGKTPRMRKASPDGWTKAKEAEFLSALEETCNVTAAAAVASVSVSSAYRRRKSHAAFRIGWHEAIGLAYQRLELALIERALVGTEKIVRRKDGSEEVMREYPNAIALTLLRMHRDTAAEACATDEAPDDVEDLRKRLFDKIVRLRERDVDAEPE